MPCREESGARTKRSMLSFCSKNSEGLLQRLIVGVTFGCGMPQLPEQQRVLHDPLDRPARLIGIHDLHTMSPPESKLCAMGSAEV
ncbi:hypothetical protein EYF80_027870 [Liparis tanakae]|uniref:Uncharacterized protein n=1 Tax=Liparis tanakae TaxID=230148 RepID=A0A4Z2HAA4_9TELE|nr:hypothetical protein EYF80_027870 [Liparis tanakae]